MYDMAVESFVPMLVSLGGWLDKGAAHGGDDERALLDARLAPDMYTLAQQVQLACQHARDAAGRLTGAGPAAMDEAATTLSGARDQIARTLAELRRIPASAFDGAEERDCSIPLPPDMKIVMNGLLFLRSWALPHFYFHVVTAYGILRHRGVGLGKQDYLRQVGAFVRPIDPPG